MAGKSTKWSIDELWMSYKKHRGRELKAEAALKAADAVAPFGYTAKGTPRKRRTKKAKPQDKRYLPPSIVARMVQKKLPRVTGIPCFCREDDGCACGRWTEPTSNGGYALPRYK